MNRFMLFTFILATSCSSILAQNLKISGKLITQKDHNPVESAHILLYNQGNMIKTTISQKDGKFIIDKLKPGDYLLKITSIQYDSLTVLTSNMHKDIDLGTIELTERIYAVNEIVVNALTNSTIKLDRQLIFPTQMHLTKSTNGIELIENLGLSGIIVRKDNNSITGIRGGEIALRINGAPASQDDFVAIDPKEVIRIEYHDLPSMRYGNAEGVIDVIVKRRESGGQVAWNSRNTFDMPWGDFGASLRLNKGRSQFGVSASYTIHSYDKNYDSGVETYTYDNGSQIHRTINGIPSKFKEYYPNLSLNYSYSIPDDLLLVARINYNMWKEGTNKIPSNITETYNNSLFRNIYSMDTKTYKENKPSFDLYLQKQFKNKDILAINVVGSYFVTESDRQLLETEEEINITDIMSNVYGDKYSIIGDIYYEKPFKAGRLSAGAKHTLEYSNNSYYTAPYKSTTDLTQNKTYLYAQWMGQLKKLVYSVGFGGIVNIQKQLNQPQQVNTYLNPRLTLSYPLTPKTQLRYQINVQIANPALGNMNNVIIPINQYLYWQGNPYLQPYTTYTNTLSLIHKFKKISVNLSLNDNYTPNGIMDYYFQDDDKIITNQINGDALHRMLIMAGINIPMFKDKLNFNINGGLVHMQSKAETYNHIVNNWLMSAHLSYQLHKFTLWSSFNTRSSSLRGEYLFKGEQLLSAGIDYRYKQLTVGAGYMSNMGSYSFNAIRLSHYYSSDIKSYNQDFKNVIYLRLTWNMRFGKAYKSLDRLKYNEDTDSGISKQ